MSRMGRLRNLDYAALAMLAVYAVVLREDVDSLGDVVSVLLMLGSAGLLWWGLSGGLSFGIGRRILTVSVLLGPVFFMGAMAKTRIFFILYLLSYVMFSVKGNHWGRCLRCLSGILAASVIFTSFPLVFGLPMALLALLVFIGGLLSIWSGMNLDKSIWWFAKRSFRKETFFLLMFLTGVAAIGLRQAQIYSERQFGLSGLSADLSPGGVRRLILSEELAIRIKFKDPPPFDPSQAYIRAIALDVMSGFDWSVGPSRIMSRTTSADVAFENQISLSPKHSQFTPVVDYGVTVFEAKNTEKVYLPRDNGVFSLGSLDMRWKQYGSRNRLTPAHTLEEAEFEKLLQVDRKTADQLIDIASGISRGAADLELFVSKLREFYRSNGFSYSLNIKRDADSPRDFLINTKEGFCEHYAAVSATLARLSGIPARVVSGFLGGFWDAGRETLFVRDLDAHAWNEFWDKDRKQWIRFDAVAVLAPERIEHGGANFMRLEGFDVADDSTFNDGLWFTDFAITLNDFLLGLNSGLSVKASEAFVEYGEELALLGALGLTVSYIVLVKRRHRRNAKRPDLLILSRLQKILAARELSKAKGEPVFDWLMRCASRQPSVAEQIGMFAAAHTRYCHDGHNSKEDLLVMSDCLKKIETLMR